VLRRLLLILVFAVGLTGPIVLAEQSADASVTRRVAMRSERVVRSVTAAAAIAFTRPATSVATYWRGNADARVTLAFSSDGVHFGTPQSAGRDEMGEQRKNGTTYGALLSAPGAVAVRVSTDRPLAQLTVLGLSDGVTTIAEEPTSSSTPAVASAATAEPSIVSRRSSIRPRSSSSTTRPPATITPTEPVPRPRSGRSTTTTRLPRTGVTSATTS
jgi:hypothetical protein